MMNSEEIDTILSDISKVTPYSLFIISQDEWKAVETYIENTQELWIDIHNSDMGLVRLDSFFNCNQPPFVYMVENACKNTNKEYPKWFVDKYSTKKDYKKEICRLKSLALEIFNVCDRYEINNNLSLEDSDRLNILGREVEDVFRKLNC